MTVVNRLATLAFGLIATACVSPALAQTNGDHMSAARACATWAAGMRAPRITCWLDAPAVVAVLICVVFGQLGGTAHASACADEIAQLSERSASLQPQAGAALSAPQSIGAHLGHQPTPESVQRAEEGAWSNLATLLARAEALDADGKQAECMATVANARRILELN